MKLNPYFGSLLLLGMTHLYTSNSVAEDNCHVLPTIEPVIKWEWSGSSTFPYHNQVMSTPIVVPLEDTNNDGYINQEDVPSVVFNTFSGRGYRRNGILRAVSGKDGHELWTITNPAHRTYPSSSIASADIDNDGIVEIISRKSGNGLVVFENTGEFKWETEIPLLTDHLLDYGGISIADLDADGTPEIIAGRTVLNADGSLKWQVNDYTGYRLTSIADINLDGYPEVILGASAYSNQGGLLWRNTQAGDGFTAIANFDEDDYPEIVVVNSGRVHLLNHEGDIIWGPVNVPYGGSGAPTVADVDGDNKVEIGIAGANQYVVFDTDGQILWTSPTRDNSSKSTGSSVFDFDGDGKVEVVYNDELRLRIYNGMDGQVLFETQNTSGTTFELPVITDVDNDGHADIVIAANSYAFGGKTGIRVFENKNNDWVNTRKIWNQHAYHVTNISDDGSVPKEQKPSWLPYSINGWSRFNSYRAQPSLSPTPEECETLDVKLASFKGSFDPQAQAVSLNWQALDNNYAGFNVWRATVENDQLKEIQQLNSQVLTEETFLDSTVSANKTYYYALESIDLSGVVTRHLDTFIAVSTD